MSVLDDFLDLVRASGRPMTHISRQLGYKQRLQDWAIGRHMPSLRVFERMVDAAGYRLIIIPKDRKHDTR